MRRTATDTLPSEAGPRTPSPRVVRAESGRLVGPDGAPVHLRGVGLGTWLLPEGYMWGFGDAAASPRQIEALVRDLLGARDAERFWREFRARFVTEADVAAIAAWGFDHVRLPINWRVLMTDAGTWREDGFALVDRLIEWCRASGLLVLLDLHGAPGGQTGTNIDDSDGRPELFMDPRNEDLTVALWTEIARRYRDEQVVLGYDLLNEPLPHEWQHRYPGELVALYKRLTAAVRAEDPHHLIMYEGTHWATSWEIFTEVWDENSALQFHKYWSAPDRPSIQRFLDVGEHLGLPVYMGEGGENSPAWLAAAHQLYEDCGIGWNFWTWKKVETPTSPLSVSAPRGWDAVMAYAAGEGPRPSREDARRIFDELLVNVHADACSRRDDVVAALFRRAPVTLPAHAFTFRGPGVSYGTTVATPHPGLRRDEAVALRRRDGGDVLDFEHLPEQGPEADLVAHLAPGEWLAYDVALGEGAWTVTVTGQTPDDDPPLVTVDGRPVGLLPSARAVTGDVTWSATHVAAVAGRAEIRVGAGAGPLALVTLSVQEVRA